MTTNEAIQQHLSTPGLDPRDAANLEALPYVKPTAIKVVGKSGKVFVVHID